LKKAEKLGFSLTFGYTMPHLFVNNEDMSMKLDRKIALRLLRIPEFKLSKSDFWRETMGFFTNINNIFSKVFKDNFQHFFETGISNKFRKDIIDKHTLQEYYKNFSPYKEKKEPVPLSFTMLQSGFVIWLVAVATATIFFFAEIIHFRITTKFEVQTKVKLTIESQKVSIFKNC
jgi:hypothetical protein